jgi:hypothetical protein
MLHQILTKTPVQCAKRLVGQPAGGDALIEGDVAWIIRITTMIMVRRAGEAIAGGWYSGTGCSSSE